MDANKVMRSVGFILGVAEGLLAAQSDNDLAQQVYADLEAAYYSVKEEMLGSDEPEASVIQVTAPSS